jgi:hypothetical protein
VTNLNKMAKKQQNFQQLCEPFFYLILHADVCVATSIHY